MNTTQVLDLFEAFLGQPPLSPEELHQLQLQHQLKHAQAALAQARSANPSPQAAAAQEAGEWRVELSPLSELASEKLKNLLLVMAAAGAFAPGEETIGAELWALTWAVVDERFRFCPGLQQELFGAAATAGGGGSVVQQPPPPHEPMAAELTGPLPAEEQELELEGDAAPSSYSQRPPGKEQQTAVSGTGAMEGDVVRGGG